MSALKHEHSDMDTSDISELIKAAKAQQKEKQQKALEEKKSHQVQPAPIPKETDIESVSDASALEHGSYVKTKDGVGGIVIDHDYELQKVRDNNETSQKLMALMDNNSLVTDANAYVPDYGEDAPEGYNPGVEYIKNNPYDPKVTLMIQVKEGFAGLTYGLPGHGLVDANSLEGKKVTEALDKLRSGEIVLPTPEEYEEQKRIAKERREQRLKEKESGNKPNDSNVNNNPNQSPYNNQVPDNDEISMAAMPDNAVVKNGLDYLLDQLNDKK